MQITIAARSLELTPALRRHTERKLKKLEKYLDSITSAHVILSIEKYRQIAEITLRARDVTIRGEEATEDLYSSVDLVMDKLERQLRRYKEKSSAHQGRGGQRTASSAGRSVKAPPLDEEPRVVKVKRFAFKPLSLEEAIIHMNLEAHNFFVFRNADTEEVNVLYRRKDGNFGLIEPES